MQAHFHNVSNTTVNMLIMNLNESKGMNVYVYEKKLGYIISSGEYGVAYSFIMHIHIGYSLKL